MSSNKTISINPSLFSVGSSKTRKNRGEKKPKPTNVPIISPNVLKNKLLKRIKEHKQKETQNLDKKKTDFNIRDTLKQSLNSNGNTSLNDTENENENFSNEFNDSIEYLQSLSKQKKLDEEKVKYDNAKQKRRAELERRTVKNYHSLSQPNVSAGPMPMVNIDLPFELQSVEPAVPVYNDPIRINITEPVPYGILKNGLKPTYRQWAKTQRNPVVMDPNASLVIQSSRENRLNMLKEKIRRKNMEIKSDPIVSDNLIKKPTFVEPRPTNPVSETSINVSPANVSPTNVSPTNVSPTPSVSLEPGQVLVGTKHITKKTVKRKYSLGRSNIKRKVAVLIKDKGTRKRVIAAQKDLKRRNINDVKDYLRKHNLWSVGSNAPNDVLRQMYESAMLAGEITNNNTETLLHNIKF